MIRRLIFWGLVYALVLTPRAAAAIQIKGVDASSYPTIRATVVTDGVTDQPPGIVENGRVGAGLSGENLGRAKSVVIAIDRSQSMEGRPLRNAIAAARAFVRAKAPGDRIQVVVFGHEAQALTSFSSSTIDADAALRNLIVDPTKGTSLYDAVVLASNSASGEALPARVVVLLTDGRDVSSKSSVADAVDAAHDGGVAVYAIGIEGPDFDSKEVKQIASATGGSYYGAASSDALADVYASIASELRRTWQVDYVTSARPGDRIALQATSDGERSAAFDARLPGSTPPPPEPKESPLLPAPVLDSPVGPFVLGLIVFLILLAAFGLLFAGKKGAWLSRRLEPHVGDLRGVKVSGDGDRLALAAGLFRATERTLGHLRPWQHVGHLLARADLPLRTVEFFYVASGASLLGGILVAAFGGSTLFVLAGLLGGGFVPYFFIAYKARRRLRAFEAQLPDLLITMAASLKAGHSFRQGMQAVIEEDQEPASKEFKRVLAETRLGRPMDAALTEMAQRIGSNNFEFVITAVTIQRQIGGSLAGIFDMVADTVRDRQQFARKIKGLTAMGRMSAYVLIGLPFFVLAMITMVNADYMSPLWNTNTGHKLLIGMLVMMAFGSMILKKIVSFRG
ncbi:MAG TPA: type II secretion system F family protein [Gaiellaceae bacterium]|jgi:tight adherence protein B